MAKSVVHFSDAFERVLVALEPAKSPTGTRSFPRGVRNSTTRIGDNEALLTWLGRIQPSVKLADVVVYPNLVFLAEVTWDTVNSAPVLVQAHAQALISTGREFEEMLKTPAPADAQDLHYHRLDFDPKNLGATLHDPLPHVHALQKGPPRFPLSDHRSIPHVDFIEFVHRNYFPDRWQEWADNVWRRRSHPDTSFSTTTDPHQRIKTAFKESKHEVILSKYESPVKAWKRWLRKEKKRMTSITWHAPFELLGY